MKTSHIPVTAPSRAEPHGLFVIVESKRVILPLKGVECDFSVIAGIAEVSITQIYRQENEKPLDAEYLFPLPADASVYSCEADINGRTIRARVREREEARRIAAEKKAAGFRTALVEAERENLFTLSLGNVQPGDLVIIQLKYFQTQRSLAGMRSVEIPFCPGVRYIPGRSLLRSNRGKGVVDDTDKVPDASRISPVRIDAGHPDAAYIEVRGTLDGKFVNERELVSPSHAIRVQRAGEELRVNLSDKGEVPDRDFVLRWTETKADSLASRAWVCTQADETYALLEIRAPEESPTERAPVDFYFLVDRSGSMAGEKWTKAAEALQACMKVLGPADRAMVTLFESEFRDFAERPLSVQKLLQDREFQTLAMVGTGGGTELEPALKHALETAAEHSADRIKNLILITDAQIGNESAILKLMKGAPDLPVHCFGIDVALNDSLLLALCRQQGGTFHSLNPNDDIEQAMTSLGKTLGQPVLLDLRLPDGWEPADAVIPNLYARQIHYLSVRSTRAMPLTLRARNAVSQPVTVQFDPEAACFDAPYLHWCRSRIQRLVAEGDEQAAIALSVKSNLICPLTAFVAWDEAEKVVVATHELVQPSVSLECRGLMSDVACCETLFESFCGAATDRWPAAMLKLDGLLREPLMKRGGAWRTSRRSRGKAPDELELKRELSEICHATGVPDWQALMKRILDWIAAADKADRAKRIEAFDRLVQEIHILARFFGEAEASQDPRAMDSARAAIRQVLKDFVDGLPVQ